MPAYIIYGDSFLVPAELQRLLAEAGAAELLDANRHRLRADDAKPGDVIATCAALPFLDARRLVVVEGLLTHAERRAGRGGARARRGAAASGPNLGGWEAVAGAIPQFPPTTLLVLTDGAVSENNPLLAALRPVAEARALQAPSGEALARWVKTTAEAKGSRVTPAAINALVELVGNDLWTLDRELEKLSLYAAGRAIEEGDVTELVPQVREASIFNAVDAIVEGRPAVALRLLRQLQQDGKEALYIIAMLERQLRLLALARDLTERGVPPSELGRRMGVASAYAVKKTVEQARRHPWPDLARRYQRLLEADLSIKQGRDPDLALELLVADLAARG